MAASPGRRGAVTLALALLGCGGAPASGAGGAGTSGAATTGAGGGGACMTPTRVGVPRQIQVTATQDVGALGKPAVVTGRDGGNSARVGGRVLWSFGDSLLKMAASDGQHFRSSTAAYQAKPGDLLGVSEALDGSGAPLEMLPFTPDEQAFNDAGSGDNRFALWPGAMVEGCDGGALVFYNKLRIHPGVLNYEEQGAGLAHLAPPSTVATRDAGFLFQASENPFNLGGLRDGDFVYLYACEPVPMQLDEACQIARVSIESAGDRSKYTFWNGGGWGAELAAAATVLHGPPGDLSVSWNAHLDAFLAVHSAIFSSDIVAHTAPRPEGPWSAPVLLMSGLAAPPMSNDYAGKEHPELSPDGGKTLVITYARPLGGFDGELRVARVTLE